MIKAHVYTAKVDKRIYRGKFNKFPHKFSQYQTEINNKTGKDMTIIKINEFPVLKKDSELVDFDKTVEKLKEITLLFKNTVREL